MKRIVSHIIIMVLIMCLTGCPLFVSYTMKPPEWIWGTWEGSWTDDDGNTVTENWQFSKDSALHNGGATGGNPIKGFIDGSTVFRIGIGHPTAAGTEYIFEKIDENTVKLYINHSNAASVLDPLGETTLTRKE